MNKLLVCLPLSILAGFLAAAQPRYPRTPDEAVVISADIKHFVDAYDALHAGSDTVEILQTKYFDVGTMGLKEYVTRFGLTPIALQKAIREHPEVYARVAEFYHQIPQIEKRYPEALADYQSVIPRAVFPPTYLLVADYKGIAQASKYGQLVSVELKRMDAPEILMHTILHELTHFQQVLAMGYDKYVGAYQKEDNMLELTLREGVAEFIPYYLVEKNEDAFAKLKNYRKDEVAYWKQFQSDLEKEEKDSWLNVSFKDNNKGNPIQLGYAVGYSIAKAYYLQATDKASALTRLLKMENPGDLMLESRYAPQ